MEEGTYNAQDLGNQMSFEILLISGFKRLEKKSWWDNRFIFKNKFKNITTFVCVCLLSCKFKKSMIVDKEIDCKPIQTLSKGFPTNVCR